MRRSSAVAGVVALFLVGVLVGALGDNLIGRHRMRAGPGGFGGHGGHGAHMMMSAELHRRLDLSADQQRQLDAILADTHRETLALWQEVRPRVLAVIERGQNRIAQILNPRQRQEFEVFRRERAERLRRLVGADMH
jgi:hypothetical protein